ncbi:unnamed protein product [Pleuronectes platessa]|uniref:Uncharacterized protein n=1 Tax=Pleuronectes platessa TaxID=8262 RepID=A0A9N7V999_PLEPL|nr:unnamed protein product [Pleuronectes platessa]
MGTYTGRVLSLQEQLVQVGRLNGEGGIPFTLQPPSTSPASEHMNILRSGKGLLFSQSHSKTSISKEEEAVASPMFHGFKIFRPDFN